MTPVVLVADDEPSVRFMLREILESADMEVHDVSDGLNAMRWLQDHHADLLITDLQMPGMDGMHLLEQLKDAPLSPRTLVITAHGSERHAVQAMKLGAYDYLTKPFHVDEVLQVVERAVAAVRSMQENEQLRADLNLSRHMVFSSDAMRRVALLVLRVAPRNVTILITGPSGTGKELVCEAIVSGSQRADKPFIRFNCAALPRELAEAELFGHSKGAFTGAVRARSGLFREANGGTLFLDEVGELDASTQSKLLRVLQEGVVRPVGDDHEQKVDVRLIAATNRDLHQDVIAGRFREDLYYRLNVVEIRIPPLAERLLDIPPLIDHFLSKYCERFGTGPLTIAPATRQALINAEYPGNVRELEHRVERLVALSRGSTIELEEFEEVVSGTSSALGFRERVDAFERGLIVEELRRCNGNRSECARRLNMGRVTLLDKMKHLKID